MKSAARKVLKHGLRLFLVIVATLLVATMTFNLSLGDKQIDQAIPHTYATHNPQFRRTMGVILGPDFLAGNNIQTLINGREAFPAMLEAARAARQSITLETYIFYSGSVAREFGAALMERAHAGVSVNILVDWLGNQLDDDLIEQMEKSGVQVRRYRAPRWYNLTKMNNRTHRKLLIVDGMVGFTGGVDLADKWRGNAQDPSHWRDTHFRITGPVVAQLQAAFVDNWLQATGGILHGTRYFPDLEPAGPLSAQVFTSAPGGGSESMQLMYLLSISAAERSIRLSAAYFVPDEAAIAALADAARRGVRVQIIVPGEHIDWDFVRRASRHRWGELLQAGVEIYEYQPTMYHVKMLIVDAVWVSVGSSNFDQRSIAINDEANLNVYDEGFSRSQIAVFNQDLAHARRVTLQDWNARSWHDRMLDACASLFGPQL